MKLSGQTVLITGGATGIGLALAEGLLLAGNRVLVCGRREDKLLAAQAQFPALEVKRCDISKPEDRQALATWAREAGVNVLVNNAGVQRMIDLRQGLKELEAGDNEARINFEGPAPRPLERFGISRNAEGYVTVDMTAVYRQELAQWDHPGSYLTTG